MSGFWINRRTVSGGRPASGSLEGRLIAAVYSLLGFSYAGLANAWLANV